MVSPLGCGSELAWSRLLAARSGLAALPEWAAALPARVAGIVPTKADDPDGGFDPDLVVAPKDQRRMDRFILFALVATAEAVAQAAWTPSDAHSLERTATVIASGIGGFPAIVEAVRTTDQRGVRRLSLHRAVLSRKSRGRSYFHPLRLQGSHRHAGYRLRRERAGDRRCRTPHSNRRSGCCDLRWLGSLHRSREPRRLRRCPGPIDRLQ